MIYCAFPSLGKSTLAAKDSRYCDLDFGLIRYLAGGDPHSNDRTTNETLGHAKKMFNLLAKEILSQGRIVLTNEPTLEFPYGERVIFLLPSYDVDEAVRRVQERGSDPAFVEKVRTCFQSWVMEWKRYADSHGYSSVYCKTVEDYFRQ